MSVSIPVPYCFDNFSFVIYFEIRRCEGFSFVLFAQDCMALGSLRFRVNFSIRNICKICHHDFDMDYIESADHLGYYGHFNNINFSNL